MRVIKVTEPVRIIIAGSRTFNDYDFLAATMDRLTHNMPDVVVVHGGARGADRLGGIWASRRDFRTRLWLPEWDRLGRGAGFARNVQMAEDADALVAFWDGASKGTGHMITTARGHGLRVQIIEV